MAFQLVDNLENRIFRIRQKGGSFALLNHVGRDDFRRANFFIHVGLEPCPLWGTEYFFSLIEVDAVTREELPYFSGRTVSRLIGAPDRQAILSVVLRGTEMLLKNIAPDQVHRCTHDAALPPAALEKHDKIGQIFNNCGYVAARSGVHHGKRFWVMERKASPPTQPDEGLPR